MVERETQIEFNPAEMVVDKEWRGTWRGMAGRSIGHDVTLHDVACDRACSMSRHDFARHRKQNMRNQAIYPKPLYIVTQSWLLLKTRLDS